MSFFWSPSLQACYEFFLVLCWVCGYDLCCPFLYFVPELILRFLFELCILEALFPSVGVVPRPEFCSMLYHKH